MDSFSQSDWVLSCKILEDFIKKFSQWKFAFVGISVIFLEKI